MNAVTSQVLILVLLTVSFLFQGAEICDSEICRRPEARGEFIASLQRVLIGGTASVLVQKISP